MTELLPFACIVGAVLVGAVSPGPSFVYVSRLSLAGSRRVGLYAALGMGAGGSVFATLALLGLVALLQQVEWLFFTLKVCGGGYLMYLGVKIWWGASSPLALAPPERKIRPQSAFRAFSTGFAVQVANPKTAVVYAGIFAALLPPDPSTQLLVTIPPALFVVEACWYVLVATLLSAPGPQAVYVRGKTVLDRCAGGMLGLLGARLVLNELRPS